MHNAIMHKTWYVLLEPSSGSLFGPLRQKVLGFVQTVWKHCRQHTTVAVIIHCVSLLFQGQSASLQALFLYVVTRLVAGKTYSFFVAAVRVPDNLFSVSVCC